MHSRTACDVFSHCCLAIEHSGGHFVLLHPDPCSSLCVELREQPSLLDRTFVGHRSFVVFKGHVVCCIAAQPTGPCPAGQYNTTTGVRPCSLCPIGTYSLNATTCAHCPVNTTTLNPGSLSVSDCSVNASNALFYFQKFPTSYFPGSNAAGYYIEAVDLKTVEQCAQLCLNDAGCLSFDAGVPGEFQSGDCFLSYDNRFTDGNTSIIPVSQLDYYEKINGGFPDAFLQVAHCVMCRDLQ